MRNLRWYIDANELWKYQQLTQKLLIPPPFDYHFSDQSILGTCLRAMCFINALYLTPNLEINAYFIIFLWGVLLFTIDLTGMKGLPLTRPSCWHFADELLNFKTWINLTIVKTDGLMIFCAKSNVFIIRMSKQLFSCFALFLDPSTSWYFKVCLLHR